ncbi:MAG: ATP synthase F0 subunit A [Deltaproteobacteria bacterium RIFOXYA12_FULL_61_11]|nr:MAG: ATP synthase F0 subunit A [Deltaproteobacteria bacterium RIFOXYA12_FULL_61_11]
MEHGFTWFGSIPYLQDLPGQLAAAIFVMLFILISSVIAVQRLAARQAKAQGNILPEAKLSFLTVYDFGIDKLYGLVKGLAGHDADKFIPLIATSFIYIFVSNLLGVIPGFLPPTSNLHNNAACALVIFVATHYFGFRAHGAGYVKHFMGPVIYLAPMMVIIEVISHCVRPMSLTLRLWGNINGDHAVLAQFSDLVPILVPVIFLGFGIWVAFLQAFIFTMLSIVYLSMAVAHDH